MTLEEIEYYHPYRKVAFDIEESIHDAINYQISEENIKTGTSYIRLKRDSENCEFSVEVQVEYEYEHAVLYGQYGDAKPEWSSLEWVVVEIDDLLIWRGDLEGLTPPKEYLDNLKSEINE